MKRQAHPTLDTLPEFPIPTLPVRRDRIDPLYGIRDGRASGFRTEPEPLGIPEDALAIGICIGFLMWVAGMSGAFDKVPT